MHDAEEINVGSRMQMVRKLWEQKDNLPDDLRDLIAQHEDHITGRRLAGATLENTVSLLQASVSEHCDDLNILYNEGTDVLEALTQSLETERTEPVVQLEEVDPEEPELRRRVLGEWKRWANSRGAVSAKFRSSVRAAYGSTCAICGRHFPATSKNRSPGVDAAHILPWSQYNLDNVSNGICLCKEHHWAFDEGLVRIIFSNGSYLVHVPAEISESIIEEHPNYSVSSLTMYEGEIPDHRLPEDPDARPHWSFLQRLNEELDMA